MNREWDKPTHKGHTTGISNYFSLQTANGGRVDALHLRLVFGGVCAVPSVNLLGAGPREHLCLVVGAANQRRHVNGGDGQNQKGDDVAERGKAVAPRQLRKLVLPVVVVEVGLLVVREL